MTSTSTSALETYFDRMVRQQELSSELVCLGLRRWLIRTSLFTTAVFLSEMDDCHPKRRHALHASSSRVVLLNKDARVGFAAQFRYQVLRCATLHFLRALHPFVLNLVFLVSVLPHALLFLDLNGGVAGAERMSKP